jgi:hypothetical protein
MGKGKAGAGPLPNGPRFMLDPRLEGTSKKSPATAPLALSASTPCSAALMLALARRSAALESVRTRYFRCCDLLTLAD